MSTVIIAIENLETQSKAGTYRNHTKLGFKRLKLKRQLIQGILFALLLLQLHVLEPIFHRSKLVSEKNEQVSLTPQAKQRNFFPQRRFD